MGLDKKTFLNAGLKYGLNVKEGNCEQFLKKYNLVTHITNVVEYLERLEKNLHSASLIANRAAKENWFDTDYSITEINHEFGTSHVAVSSFFDITSQDVCKIKKNIEKIKYNVDRSLLKSQSNTLKALKYNNYFYLVDFPLTYNIDEYDEQLIVIPSLTDAKKKIKQSDEIMHLLSFWLNHGGKPSFSASSKFTLFCSACLPKTSKNKFISTKALEARFIAMNLPKNMVHLFKKLGKI